MYQLIEMVRIYVKVLKKYKIVSDIFEQINWAILIPCKFLNQNNLKKSTYINLTDLKEFIYRQKLSSRETCSVTIYIIKIKYSTNKRVSGLDLQYLFYFNVLFPTYFFPTNIYSTYFLYPIRASNKNHHQFQPQNYYLNIHLSFVIGVQNIRNLFRRY